MHRSTNQHQLHSWTYAELASHLLTPLVFLMYCLGAPELLLRKAIALELLVLFVRFMFIARAVPNLGPMITMLVKVSSAGAAGPHVDVSCSAQLQIPGLLLLAGTACTRQPEPNAADPSSPASTPTQVAWNMRHFLLLVLLLMAASSALLTTLLPPLAAVGAPVALRPPPADGGPSCPTVAEDQASKFHTYGSSLLQLFVIMMGGVVRAQAAAVCSCSGIGRGGSLSCSGTACWAVMSWLCTPGSLLPDLQPDRGRCCAGLRNLQHPKDVPRWVECSRTCRAAPVTIPHCQPALPPSSINSAHPLHLPCPHKNEDSWGAGISLALLMLWSILVIIVLVNFLIAVVNSTYDFIKEREELLRLNNAATVVDEIEGRMAGCQGQQDGGDDGPFLHVLLSRQQGEQLHNDGGTTQPEVQPIKELRDEIRGLVQGQLHLEQQLEQGQQHLAKQLVQGQQHLEQLVRVLLKSQPGAAKGDGGSSIDGEGEGEE